MNFLLILAGVLSVISGLIKCRERVRTHVGVSLFALLEILAGAGLPLMILTDTGPGARLSALGAVVGLVVVSSVHQYRVASTLSRKRTTSEGARLRAHVNYLSMIGDDPSQPGAAPRNR